MGKDCCRHYLRLSKLHSAEFIIIYIELIRGHFYLSCRSDVKLTGLNDLRRRVACVHLKRIARHLIGKSSHHVNHFLILNRFALFSRHHLGVLNVGSMVGSMRFRLSGGGWIMSCSGGRIGVSLGDLDSGRYRWMGVTDLQGEVNGNWDGFAIVVLGWLDLKSTGARAIGIIRLSYARAACWARRLLRTAEGLRSLGMLTLTCS